MEYTKKDYKKIIKKIDLNHKANLNIAGNFGRKMDITMDEAFLFKKLIEEKLTENLILFGVGCSKPIKEEIDFIIYKDKKFVHKTYLETLIDNGTYVEVK